MHMSTHSIFILFGKNTPNSVHLFGKNKKIFVQSQFFVPPQAHFVSALTVVFVNSKSLSSIRIDDTPVDDPSLKVLVANNSDTLKLLKMSSCPHVSPAGNYTCP